MGNKHTLEDDLITFKLTSKQFGRDGALIMVKRFFDMENSSSVLTLTLLPAKKCDKNEITQKAKLKKAIEQV